MGIKLTATRSDDATQRLEFRSDKVVITVGRNKDNDFVLPGNFVSGYHARIDGGSGEYYLVDLKSRNGTRINGSDLCAHQPKLIQPSDCLQLGPWDIAMEILPSATPAPKAPPPPPPPPPAPPPPSEPSLPTAAPVNEAPASSLVDVEGEVTRLHQAMGEVLINSGLLGAPAEKQEAAMIQKLEDGCAHIPHSQHRVVLESLKSRLASLPIPNNTAIAAVDQCISRIGGAPPTNQPDHHGIAPSLPPKVDPAPPVPPQPPLPAPSPPESPRAAVQPGPAGTSSALDVISLACLQRPAPSDPTQATQLAENLSQALLGLARGFHRCLGGREDFKKRFNANTTMMVGLEHNPLKDAEAPEDLLRYLLATDSPVSSEKRISNLDNAFQDIADHQLALVRCIQEAVDHAIRLWDPELLRKEAEQQNLRRPKEILEYFESKYRELTGNIQKLYNEVIWPNVQQGYLKAMSEKKQDTPSLP